MLVIRDRVSHFTVNRMINLSKLKMVVTNVFISGTILN